MTFVQVTLVQRYPYLRSYWLDLDNTCGSRLSKSCRIRPINTWPVNNCPCKICPFNICPRDICLGNISPSSHFSGTTDQIWVKLWMSSDNGLGNNCPGYIHPGNYNHRTNIHSTNVHETIEITPGIHNWGPSPKGGGRGNSTWCGHDIWFQLWLLIALAEFTYYLHQDIC